MKTNYKSQITKTNTEKKNQTKFNSQENKNNIGLDKTRKYKNQ